MLRLKNRFWAEVVSNSFGLASPAMAPWVGTLIGDTGLRVDPRGELRLSAVGPIQGLVFGAFGEISEEARTLLCYAADATAARTWVADGATSEEHAAALLKNRLYRRWGIKTAREYARIKIDGLRLVGGNRDFTNAPGHGDDDARFYDRQ